MRYVDEKQEKEEKEKANSQQCGG